VRYRDEVWTGIEYQVAAGLLWEGMVDEALLVLHGIEQRYDGTQHNPWNEVECGDHYARALASWGVLHALAGFKYDGPAGRLTIAPSVQQDKFRCFFAAGTGWGVLTQSRSKAGIQVNAIEIRSGVLTLKRFATEISSQLTVQDVLTSAPRTPTFLQRGSHVEVEFAEPVALTAGQTLTLTIRYQDAHD